MWLRSSAAPAFGLLVAALQEKLDAEGEGGTMLLMLLAEAAS